MEYVTSRCWIFVNYAFAASFDGQGLCKQRAEGAADSTTERVFKARAKLVLKVGKLIYGMDLRRAKLPQQNKWGNSQKK